MTHPLCCHSCAPVIELNQRHEAGEIPASMVGETTGEVLHELGWENPFKPGTAELKETSV